MSCRCFQSGFSVIHSLALSFSLYHSRSCYFLKQKIKQIRHVSGRCVLIGSLHLVCKEYAPHTLKQNVANSEF